MTTHILTDVAGSVMTVRFNRPEKKNSLTMEMYDALANACRTAAADPNVRVVVFTGNGDIFCAGNDLKEFLDPSSTLPDRPVFHFMHAMSTMPKPVIAAVNGAAIGIGVTMLLHCDFIYAVPGARFQVPFVNLAITPEFASSLLLARVIGVRSANEMLLLGESFTAQRALTDGLINEIVPAENLMATVAAKAKALAALPPRALRETKAQMRGDIAEITARMKLENKVLNESMKTPELKEAVQAFFEKRPADFSRFS